MMRDDGVPGKRGRHQEGPKTLKHCASELVGPLSQVFIVCLKENIRPSVWKERWVVPVQKRSVWTEPGNYRLISLLPVVGEVFERIVGDEVCRHLDDNNLPSNQQIGFRAGRATSDLLLLLSRDW